MTYNLSWSGPLVRENYKEVGQLFNDLLSGKPFTVVSLNESGFFLDKVSENDRWDYRDSREYHIDLKHVEVRTSMILDKIWIHEDKDYCGITLSDGVYNTPIITHINTLAEARKLDFSTDHWKNPYLYFEGNRVTVIWSAPAGHRLNWTWVVEDPNPHDRFDDNKIPIAEVIYQVNPKLEYTLNAKV